MQATERQIDFIITLYNQVHGTDHRYLSQCIDLHLTMRERQGSISSVAASGIIDELKKEAAK